MSNQLLYAEKGEIVRCENGHAVCEIAQDIFVGEMQNPQTHFKNWRIKKSQKGTMCALCLCGSKFFSHNNLHFSNGWRNRAKNNLPCCKMDNLLVLYKTWNHYMLRKAK